MSKPLTPAQKRYLEDIRRSGKKVYNGRARKPIKALEAAGLVTVDWDVRFHADTYGNIGSVSERITVEPVKDHLGNMIAKEGCDRCFCGCKYWENDVCVDCGTHITRVQKDT